VRVWLSFFRRKKGLTSWLPDRGDRDALLAGIMIARASANEVPLLTAQKLI